MTVDTVIHNARIVDGAGAPWYRGLNWRLNDYWPNDLYN